MPYLCLIDISQVRHALREIHALTRGIADRHHVVIRGRDDPKRAIAPGAPLDRAILSSHASRRPSCHRPWASTWAW